mgnify:CR=1 FL=1
MLNKINWKLYGILLGMAVVSLLLGLPYVASLQGDAITFNLFINLMIFQEKGLKWCYFCYSDLFWTIF